MQHMRYPSRNDKSIDFETYYNIISNIKELYNQQRPETFNFKDFIRIAKITGLTEDGSETVANSYTAIEVTWDPTTDTFIELTGAPGWNTNADPPVSFLSLITLNGETYNVDDIVFVMRDPNQRPQWIIVGGGGGSNIYLVKITGLHTQSAPVGGDYRCVYLGDVYTGIRGVNGEPDIEDVTVICDDIAVGEQIPTNTVCQAIRATREWQEADGEWHPAETVYLIEIPRWL